MSNRSSKTLTAAVAGVAVAVAGVLLFTRPGMPARHDDATPEAAAALASTAPGARGPGIPPPPGSGGENAPPNPYSDAPTANLKRVANALRLNTRSVTSALTLPAGLNLTAPVNVSALFGGYPSERVTQDYNNTNGNRLAVNFPDRDGGRRTEPIVITLNEPDANGDGLNELYGVRLNPTIEPLYDITLSPLTFTLVSDCDPEGDSEPRIMWRNPDNTGDKITFSVSYGDPHAINQFGKTYIEVGQSKNFGVPTFSFREDDYDPFGFGAPLKPPADFGEYLLPGTAPRTVKKLLAAQNDSFCQANIKYTIAYKLRRYDLR